MNDVLGCRQVLVDVMSGPSLTATACRDFRELARKYAVPQASEACSPPDSLYTCARCVCAESATFSKDVMAAERDAPVSENGDVVPRVRTKPLTRGQEMVEILVPRHERIIGGKLLIYPDLVHEHGPVIDKGLNLRLVLIDSR